MRSCERVATINITALSVFLRCRSERANHIGQYIPGDPSLRSNRRGSCCFILRTRSRARVGTSSGRSLVVVFSGRRRSSSRARNVRFTVEMQMQSCEIVLSIISEMMSSIFTASATMAGYESVARKTIQLINKHKTSKSVFRRTGR